MQQAQLDPVGGLGEDREIGAGAVVRGAEGVSVSRPDLHDEDSSTSDPGAVAFLGPMLLEYFPNSSRIFPENGALT
ncbi:hypothetical protein GCM10010231_18300 [Streptomyces sindenensis]|nr:hypothetical protein GCM10010231_18300 [Streptomyces sindenensis]